MEDLILTWKLRSPIWEIKVKLCSQIASTLYRLDYYEDAIKIVNEGLALDPKNKDFFKLKGKIYK